MLISSVLCVAIPALTVIAFYWYTFSGSLSDRQEVWGQFGDYVGGVINPILTFFTVVGLIFTLVLQAQQLQLSRKELELTRKELRRSARAQELSEKALRLQAQAAQTSVKLATITALIEHYRRELAKLQDRHPMPGDFRYMEKVKLTSRYEELQKRLDDLFHSTSGDEE